MRAVLLAFVLALPALAQQTPVKNELLTQSVIYADTVQNSTLTNDTITGGSINNTPIGATTPAFGGFTVIQATGIIGTIAQGSFLGWNYTGSGGETDFVNGRGAGTGGYNWYSVPSNSGNYGSPLMALTAQGALSVPGGVFGGGLVGSGLSISGAATVTGQATLGSLIVDGSISGFSLGISGPIAATGAISASSVTAATFHGTADSAVNSTNSTNATHATSAAGLDGLYISYAGTTIGGGTCQTGTSGQCTYFLGNFSPALPNTTYAVSCSLRGPLTGDPVIEGVIGKFTTGVNVQIKSLGGTGENSYADGVECIAEGSH